MVGAESEFNERPGIGHSFVLPAIGSLEPAQSVFGRRVPFSRSHSPHVVLTNQGFLDLMGALSVDLLLTANFLGALAFVRTAAARRHSTRSASRMR